MLPLLTSDDSKHSVVCITGDGCFFMHGMEILTAKEHNLQVIFVVFNNARLGMVYHGHNPQYGRSHDSFEQIPINITDMASSMGIASARVVKLEDLNMDLIQNLLSMEGPSPLEIALVDENIPPMGDRVSFYLLLINKQLILVQETRTSSRSFYQLQSFIEYKANMASLAASHSASATTA